MADRGQEARGQVFSVSVGTTAQRLLTDNPFRLNWSAKNIGTNDVFFGFDQNVSSTGSRQGWTISNSGGSVSDEWWTGEVWVISGTGNNTLHVQEVAGPRRRKFRETEEGGG